MIEPTPEMIAAVKRRMGVADDAELDPWMEAAISDVLAIVYCPDPHIYLSTGCLHDTAEGHEFCRVEARRYDGTVKTASRCKFCPAPCACRCHRETP